MSKLPNDKNIFFDILTILECIQVVSLNSSSRIHSLGQSSVISPCGHSTNSKDSKLWLLLENLSSNNTHLGGRTSSLKFELYIFEFKEYIHCLVRSHV